jgi:signal transduction histidine kinase
MVELINNVLDLARGTMGGGLPVRRVPDLDVSKVLTQVIQELQIAWPERTLQQEISLHQTVWFDAARIAQVLSNLVANALTHGAPDQPVLIQAHCVDGFFQLSVTNRGPTIAPEVASQLFQPFARGKAHPGAQGLGLGLYIASEIARAHGGTLTVASSDGKTCFTLRIPIESDLLDN